MASCNVQKKYLSPALEARLIERIIPDKPRALSRNTN
ncbi:hypothetical protein V6380_16270 [Acinetobacter variabilis]|nr:MULTISPECIES: hypothetical protein [Acinetobacter]